MMKRYFITISIVSAFLTGCQDETYIPFVELGAVENEVVLPAEGNSVEIQVYANGAYKAELLNDVAWASLDSDKGNSDGILKLTCTANDGFRRSAVLILKSDIDIRTDTVLVKQEGLVEEILHMENTSIILEAHGGEHSELIITNIPSDQITISVTYPSADRWIETFAISEGAERKLLITAKANDNTISRTATMTISHIDAWGEALSQELTLEQKASENIMN